MSEHLAFGAWLAVCLASLAWALASPARWPWRVTAGIVALATWVSGCVSLTASGEKAVWSVALLVTLVLTTKGLTIAAAFWRRLAAERDFDRIAQQLYPEAASRVSLGELFAMVTGSILLASAIAASGRVPGDPFARIPVGVTFAGAAAVGIAAAVIAGANLAVVLSPRPDVRSFVLLIAVCVGVAVGVEFVMSGLLAIDDTLPKSMSARDLLEAMSGRWWEWTAATFTGSVAAALGLRVIGSRWVEWPYD